jgi:hypothetical protein
VCIGRPGTLRIAIDFGLVAVLVILAVVGLGIGEGNAQSLAC